MEKIGRPKHKKIGIAKFKVREEDVVAEEMFEEPIEEIIDVPEGVVPCKKCFEFYDDFELDSKGVCKECLKNSQENI